MGIFDIYKKAISTVQQTVRSAASTAVDRVVKSAETVTGIDLPGGYSREELEKKRSRKKETSAKASSFRDQAREIISAAGQAAESAAVARRQYIAAGRSPGKELGRTKSTVVVSSHTSSTSSRSHGRGGGISVSHGGGGSAPPSETHGPVAQPELPEPGQPKPSQTAYLDVPTEQKVRMTNVFATRAEKAAEELEQQTRLAETYARRLNEIVKEYESGRVPYETAKRRYDALKQKYDAAVARARDIYQEYRESVRVHSLFVKSAQKDISEAIDAAKRRAPDVTPEDVKSPARGITKDVERTARRVEDFLTSTVVAGAERVAERFKSRTVSPFGGDVMAYAMVAGASAVKGGASELLEMSGAAIAAPFAVAESVAKGSPEPLIESYTAEYARRTVEGVYEFGKEMVTHPVETVTTLTRPEVLGELAGRGYVFGKVMAKLPTPKGLKAKATEAVSRVKEFFARTPTDEASRILSSADDVARISDDALAAFMRREFAPKQPRADVLISYSRTYKSPSLIPMGGHRITRAALPAVEEVVVAPKDIYKAAKELGVKGKALKYIKSLARKKARLSTEDLARLSQMLPEEVAGNIAQKAYEIARSRTVLRSEFLATTPETVLITEVRRKAYRAVEHLRRPKTITHRKVQSYINRKFFYGTQRKWYYGETPREFIMPRQRTVLPSGVEEAPRILTVQRLLSEVEFGLKRAPLVFGKVGVGAAEEVGVEPLNIYGVKPLPKVKQALGVLEVEALPELTETTLAKSSKLRPSRPSPKKPPRRAPSIVEQISKVKEPKTWQPRPKVQKPQVEEKGAFRWPDRILRKPRRVFGMPRLFGYRELVHKVGDIFGTSRPKRGKKKKRRGTPKYIYHESIL